MGENVSRILIETIVKKTLSDIKESPERSIRNLVDMALNFSEGRFQQHFFTAAQTMLQNENSAYYDLIRDIVFHVDSQSILTFGMNVGYNSCTLGAKAIRHFEQQYHFNIPWTLEFCVKGSMLEDHYDTYASLIEQGKKLGIYNWVIFTFDHPAAVFKLVETHPNLAFTVVCSCDDITDEFLDEAEPLYNMMISVRYTENMEDICQKMRDRSLLYSIFLRYHPDQIHDILSGDLFCSAESMHAAFTMLMPDFSIPADQAEQVYNQTVTLRNRQLYETVPIDIFYDFHLIDSVISNEAHVLGFDLDGSLCTFSQKLSLPEYNLFQNSLQDILKAAVPMKESSSYQAD